MVLAEVMERFLHKSPACVMVRVLLENVLTPAKINSVFHSAAQTQYERELQFSTIVDLMSLVVTRVQPSVNAAAKYCRDRLPVSIRAVYEKLSHVEPGTCRALVQHASQELGTLIDLLGGTLPPWLAGYRCRILDGNHLSGTEHRLGVLRAEGAGALPGLALAVLDPQRRLIADVIVCPDGHTQECTLLDPVLNTVAANDVWIADRHFCTSHFLFGLWRRQGCFVIRQHAGHLVWREQHKPKAAGRCDSGRVWEQTIVLTDPATAEERTSRRITLRLQQPTRDGDREIHILTNLPATVATAGEVAELYRRRWTLETAFQELTQYLRCELNTLGYPLAALFGFSVACVSYNVLAAVLAALRAVHGAETIEHKVSLYYLSNEIAGTYRGLMIALPPEDWRPWQELTTEALAQVLLGWAQQVDLTAYPKSKRGPKKPRPPRPKASRQHVATARLLNACREKPDG